MHDHSMALLSLYITIHIFWMIGMMVLVGASFKEKSPSITVAGFVVRLSFN